MVEGPQGPGTSHGVRQPRDEERRVLVIAELADCMTLVEVGGKSPVPSAIVWQRLLVRLEDVARIAREQVQIHMSHERIDGSPPATPTVPLSAPESTPDGAMATDGNGVPPLLTRRQVRILAMYANGVSTTQIADELAISIATVRTHIRDAIALLGVHGIRQAIRRAQKLGLLPVERA